MSLYKFRDTHSLPLRSFFVLLVGLNITCAVDAQGNPPTISGCPVFPADHVFNTRIDSLPVHANSGAYVAELGAGPVHPDFGQAVDNGFPMNIVHGNSVTPAVVTINWPDTSDTGLFPIPANAVVGDTSDKHLIVLDVDNCLLYEAFDTIRNSDGSWTVDAISKFDLRSDALKPANWSSSNAAGTAQLPLLVRYEEVAAGQINHAISMTGFPTGASYIWPASHSASAISAAPPMGIRFRLKASYDISSLPTQAKVVAQALKLYGTLLTDNGASWHLQGVPDVRFDDNDLHALTQIPASAFEAVDENSLEIASTSGQINTSGGGVTTGITVSPSSGSGSTQRFAFSFTSVSQAQEHLLFNSSLNGAHACYLIYDHALNNLYIANDQGTGISQVATPGQAATLANSQCSVATDTASVSTSGNTVSVGLTVTFAGSFPGAQNIYANMLDANYLAGSWQQIGAWTSGGGGSADTMTPSSGSGLVQTFTFSYTGPNQMQEHFIFNGAFTGVGACYVIYDRLLNSLYMVNDLGTGIGQTKALGGGGTLAGGQCSLPLSAMTVSVSGNTVSLTAAITFSSSFAGLKNVYVKTVDTSYVASEWQQIGSWTP